jgi:uncharacterized protein DUF1588/uncharacterized protein DUF1592/uncharacterized protein DUF1595/uncharacterized protein DUF1587
VVLLSAALGSLGAGACQSTLSNAAPSVAEARPAGGSTAALPVRLRRLSNSEYAQTLSALTFERVELPDSFPEDVLVNGFSSNDRQAVDPFYLAEARKLARAVAERAVLQHSALLVPCSPALASCAREFVNTFARRAYRRPARAEEVDAILRLFELGFAHAGFSGGVVEVVAALLVSPQLLYVSELGVPVARGSAVLTSEEAGSVLAYMLTGGPPDEPLFDAAAAGALALPEQRARHAWRLLGKSETRFQFRRFVREWLGLDVLSTLSKPVPDERQLRLGLLAETDAFVDEVFMYEGASLDQLLTANFTVIPASLHAFQGLPPAEDAGHYGRVPLAGSARLGLLQQPSFLAVYSHESETAPVLRGKAILERLLCVELPRPAELGIQVTFPPADPRLTTRQRHIRHAEDPTCRSCHRTIDALGYTFENFDFVGRSRLEENQRPIDSSTRYDGPEGPQTFRDSRDLSRWLAGNARAHECFARQAFRFFSGHAGVAPEAAFLSERSRLPEADRRDLFRTLVGFIQSPLFMERVSLESEP